MSMGHETHSGSSPGAGAEFERHVEPKGDSLA